MGGRGPTAAWVVACLFLGGAIAKKSIGSVTQKSIGVVNKWIKWLSSTMCITLLTIFIMLTGDKLIISPPPLVLRVCTMDYFITSTGNKSNYIASAAAQYYLQYLINNYNN